MNSIPLVRNNSVNDINTSLIALRKVLRELTETTSDVNKEIEKYVLKSDVVNVVESGNDNPVTSGAVYDKVTDTINSLDVSSVGGSGKYISAISETDGKISATVSDITSTVSSNNSQPVTSGGVANALTDLFINVSSNTVSMTINANTGTSGNFTFEIPNGYKIVGFNGYTTSGPAGAINLYSINMNLMFNKTGTFTQQIYFRNYTSTAQTASINVYLQCQKIF